MGQIMGFRPHFGDHLPFALSLCRCYEWNFGGFSAGFLGLFPLIQEGNPLGIIQRKALENGMMRCHGFKPSVWKYIGNHRLSDSITPCAGILFPTLSLVTGVLNFIL